MIHPLLSTLAVEPGLVFDHLDAYADLALAEASEWGTTFKTRLLLKGAIVVCLFLGVLLAAMAGLLVAAIAWRSMPLPWMLVAVPAIPWLMALVCMWRLTTLKPGTPFALLREQVSTDLKIISAASRP
ncbi:MAG: hypothetical protein ABIR55_22390 [Burkholderiaceae bacterium]